MAEQAIRTGADVVTFMGLDVSGWAIYDSNTDPKYPGYGDKDLLREMIDILHLKGIKIMVNYCALWNRRLCQLHPEWRQVEAEGTSSDVVIRKRSGGANWPGVMAADKMHFLCMNSSARQAIIEGIKDLVTHYEIEGLWFDLPFFVVECHCPSCKALYRVRYGTDIPLRGANLALRKQFIRFRRDCVIEFSKDVSEGAKSVNPDLIFKTNMFAVQHSRLGMSIDSGAVMDTVLNDIYPAKGSAYHSVTVRLLKSASRRGLAEPLYMRQSNRFLGGVDACTYYASTKSQSQILTEAFTAIANGCACCIGDFMHPEGYFYDEIIDRISDALKQIKDREEWLVGAVAVPFAVLYFSQDTRDMYGMDIDHKFLVHFDGAARAMLEEHIPFDVVHHRNLAQAFEDGLKVLILPNVACLDENRADEIRTFVKAGGGLMATYESSLYDENGDVREDFLLSDLFGASYCGDTGFYSDFLEMAEEHPVTDGMSRKIPLQHLGPQLKVRANSDTKVPAQITTPYWKDHGTHYVGLTQPPGIRTDFPAIVANEYGKGRVVYLPNRTDAVYTELETPEAGLLIANAVRWAAGEQILELEPPPALRPLSTPRGSRAGPLSTSSINNPPGTRSPSAISRPGYASINPSTKSIWHPTEPTRNTK